jgi:hypothetical protein
MGLFGLQPWLAQPKFWSLTTIHGSVWITTNESLPHQFFGKSVQILCPHASEIGAAKLIAKISACQFWLGWLGA